MDQPRPGRTGGRGRRWAVAALAVALGAGLVACSGDDATPGDAAAEGASASSTTTTATTEAESAPLLYVSLGDSYAQGYQPGRPPEGFADVVPELAGAEGWDLELVNFGCGGATTLSLAEELGCVEPARAPGGPVYEDVSQLDAAIELIEEERDRVGLITVSIGGNDVTACVAADDPVSCVTTEVDVIRDDLVPSLERLRAAAGPDVPIVGLTYPNVILGSWVRGSQDLAELSVIAFRELINPALADAYAAIDGIFVDVTDGTGAYTPLTETTTLEPYGEIPVAVAEVCELTWYCEEGDIHARSEGYRAMAELIVAALPPAP